MRRREFRFPTAGGGLLDARRVLPAGVGPLPARAGSLPARAAARGVIAGVLALFTATLASALCLLVLAAPAASAAEGTCPNEAIRIEQGSTYLPECRAYEMVSPVGESPYLEELAKNVTGAHAAASGEEIAWFSYYPIEGSHGGFQNLSTRTASGWSTVPVGPQTSTDGGDLFACTPAVYFSEELNEAVLSDGIESESVEHEYEGERGYCGKNEPPLVEGEPQGAQNVFLRSTATGAYQLVDVTPSGVSPANAFFQDASSDFSRIFFEEAAKLTANAPGGTDLYEWVGGGVHLVSVLPSGTPAVNAQIVYASGAGRPNFKGPGPYMHAVSSDGRRVFFEAEGKLFVRINPEVESEASGAHDAAECGAKACTIQIDASQAGGPGGGAKFLAASAEGSEAFFSDGSEAKLTTDTQAGSGRNLYVYDLETGKLTDLTPAAQAGVLGVAGASEDGSYFYFVAEGSLASGATAGEANLYVEHEGTLSFIATLNANRDRRDWDPDLATTRVSPNGLYVAFQSVQRLTGYDNTDAITKEADTEVFRYSASDGKLVCVSCDASGQAPLGPAILQAGESAYEVNGDGYLSRSVLNDGRVFFDSPDPLVQSDVNGKTDVYEYANGGPQLISSGTSSAVSLFYDASENGNDVFFITTQGLVRADTDNSLSLYDARVNGGFAEPPESAECGGEGCKGSPPPSPSFSAPSSASFSGEGNLAPPSFKPAGKSRKASKLTRRQKLAKALKACAHRRSRRERQLCRRRARRRYHAKTALHRADRRAHGSARRHRGGSK